ncbi:hypothetical protein HUZ36_19800 [Pseudoalteromonas sp. McH1-7]|uniref:Flagellar basal-body/hook protein C-terminal domain-containing protein n=1 Tax=Pseudoalteromonas peptidolytica F12-50-A1 TaxID=1315280 RepID=A0A8I0T579_9GAMM|nr:MULTISPECIES: hypothetical protein [Pseudoalteromonas]MBE0347790.1 hypothetical protein [Pseudoalteromonas peptidolytica F12-50-A1]MDW7551465.1 hypothetical protein [Pseudoalteromonas peptidolytica]NLR16823.1 hypothetical protein [Pseudoalteromonas peptidolytica]NUZ13025.1 hypothetical protein [Pseudoalteromonas sp. McH1-7]RRS07264.1 hypothetical protein EAG18_18015 [Pseudoalteromonas sp. J010]
MPIGDVLNNGIDGYNRAAQGIAQASADINRAAAEEQTSTDRAFGRQLQGASTEEAVTAPVSETPSLTESVVALKVEEFNAKANVQSIRTADEALGTLIDIKV